MRFESGSPTGMVWRRANRPAGPSVDHFKEPSKAPQLVYCPTCRTLLI